MNGRQQVIALLAAALCTMATCEERPQKCARLSSVASEKPTSAELKKLTGYKAVDAFVKNGMVVGLGTGSTAYFAVERIGQKLASGELRDIIGVPTSRRTQAQAESLSIPLATLATHSHIDVCIDGADEVTFPKLELVKGRGGALLREKMIAACADRFVVVVDGSKILPGLGGTGGTLPVEVVKFGWQHVQRQLLALASLKACGATAMLRRKDGVEAVVAGENDTDGESHAFVTDNDNYILDLRLERALDDPGATAQEIKGVVGVVEHGFFLDMATEVVVASDDGVDVRTKSC